MKASFSPASPWAVAATVAACASAAAWAQTPAPDPAAPITDLGRVEVRSERNSDAEQRRNASVSKIVIGREEIERQGDGTLGEVLKRLPGVTVQGAPGRGGAIRMRGLGGGYTQILLDGERVPPGFSIDQITPEQVERIEILRAPTAETGARAVAGTINIVLREGRRQAPDDLKLSATQEGTHTSGQAIWSRNLQWAGMQGNFTLSATDAWRPDQSTTITDYEGVSADARPDRERITSSLGHRRAINGNARLQWKGEQGRTLTLTPFWVFAENESNGQVAVRTLNGSSTFADSARTQSHSRFGMGRLNGQWTQRLSADDRLEVRFGLGQSQWDYRFDQSQANGTGPSLTPGGPPVPLLRNGFETQSFVDRSHNATGKWTRVLPGGHQIVSGLELEQVRRSEDGNAGLGEDVGQLQARTQRWALYSQDEFRINPQWGAYVGLRYEAITTEGTLNNALRRNESSVWTPLLHATYKPDPQKRDQWRMSLTRSYKTPTLHQLVARYVPALGSNSPTNPDRTGNPELRPELATGLELGYERYLPQGGVLSANVFVRDISDLIRNTTSLDCLNIPADPNASPPPCISSPQNVGVARTQGLELEAKFRLNQWWPQALPVDVRANTSFFHSTVQGVPGPNNRLDQQPSYTANFGADYRWRGQPLTLGGNLNLNPAYDTRRTENQWVYQGAKQVLDVYGLWRFSPAHALRVSVTNALAYDYLSGNTFRLGNFSEDARSRSRSWSSLQLRWEMRI